MSVRLDTPLKTSCGLVFPNRLVKAAMAEGLADKEYDPTDKYVTLYDTWSNGGWGGILTGEVEVSSMYMGSPDSVASKASPTQATKDKWKRWALAAQQNNTPALVQLAHPGGQCMLGAGDRSFFAKNIAPSAVAPNIGNGILDWLFQKVVLGTPRAMSVEDIHMTVQQFAAAAKMCHDSGFSGVEIHAAHGFLLTQFLSPKTNLRTDDYGGTPAKRARIVVEIIRAIRAVVPESFCVGIKLNSADVGGHESLEESLEQIGLIAKAGIDFVEVSGGTMEKMRMFNEGEAQAKSARTMHREAFFLEYARAVRSRYPEVLLMVTGGFRSRAGMQAALDSGACDLIGLGRPSAVWPKLAKEVLLNKEVKDEDATCDLRAVRGNWFVRNLTPRIVGVGIDALYYAKQIALVAQGKATAPPPIGA